MERASAYMGLGVDHLIETCPALNRSRGQRVCCEGGPRVGDRCLGTVEVNGTDLCGWCVRVWRARDRSAA